MTATTAAFEAEGTVAELAQSLGLRVVIGSPAAHYPDGFVPMRLRGAPHGRDVVVEQTGDGDTRIAVALRVRVPRFEVFSRTTPLACIPPSLHLPSRYFGGRGVDRVWRIFSEDPHVGTRIAPAMREHSATSLMRIESTGTTLEARSTRHAGQTLLEAERLLYVLEEIARLLEGVPLLVAPSGVDDEELERASRCHHCGGPAEEVPAGVHQPIEVACPYCGARVDAVPALAGALRAVRVAAAGVEWAREDARRAVSRAHRWMRPWLPSVVVTLVAVCVFYAHMLLHDGAFAPLRHASHEVRFAVAAAELTLVALSAIAAWWASPRVLALVLARAQTEAHSARSRAPRPCLSFECVSCGGTARIERSAIAVCAYCGGANLPAAEHIVRATERYRKERAAIDAITLSLWIPERHEQRHRTRRHPMLHAHLDRISGRSGRIEKLR